MCIKPRRFKDLYIPNVTLNGNVLDFVTSHKYLGYYIDASFTDNKDISRQTRSIYAQGNSLVRKFKHCSAEVKSQLFKSYCSSFYCTTVWSNYKPTALQKLNVAYKRIFRSLFSIKSGSITGIMLQNNCNPLIVILRKLINGFRTRLITSDNSLVHAIVNSVFYLNSAVTRKWNRDLFSFS